MKRGNKRWLRWVVIAATLATAPIILHRAQSRIMQIATRYTHSTAWAFSRSPSDILFDPSHDISRVDLGELQKIAQTSFVWSQSYFGFNGSMDWSAYDYIELDVNNLDDATIPFVVEVKDRDSVSYWTRANQPFVLGP